VGVGAFAEQILVVEVAHTAGVVVAGHAHDLVAGKRRQLLLRERVLVGVALVGEVAATTTRSGSAALISSIAVRRSDSR
jgi:hypothetical protein